MYFWPGTMRLKGNFACNHRAHVVSGAQDLRVNRRKSQHFNKLLTGCSRSFDALEKERDGLAMGLPFGPANEAAKFLAGTPNDPAEDDRTGLVKSKCQRVS